MRSSEETVTEGIEEVPVAFLGMMRGTNTGKALVSMGTGQRDPALRRVPAGGPRLGRRLGKKARREGSMRGPLPLFPA
ncbi:hypothetical protein [Streptomyces syringium]|uniref:hypothetical protein n=1 Tax=Streptomyces syringium TaxID=76729 RepID=UPI00345661DC